jgi:hypothetical protein
MRVRPELFQAVVAVSPWLTWDGRKELALLKPFLASDAVKTRALFYASGNEGPAMADVVASLTNALEARKGKGLRFASAHFPDENHGSVVLPGHYAALRMIFAGWALPAGSAGARSPGTLAEVRKYYADLGERLGFPITPPEVAVNQAGYDALGREDVPAAIDLFRFNAAAYPESPGVHAGLGNALETGGDLPAALESYGKAEELGRKSGEPRTALFHADAERVRSELARRPAGK